MKKGDDGKYHYTGHPNWGTQQPLAPYFAGKVLVLINGGQFLDHVRVSFDAPPSPPRDVYRRGDRRRLLRQHLRHERTVGPTELQDRYADAVDWLLHGN